MIELSFEMFFFCIADPFRREANGHRCHSFFSFYHGIFAEQLMLY